MTDPLREALGLIQMRAKYATHDDAQEALSWINSFAREARSGRSASSAPVDSDALVGALHLIQLQAKCPLLDAKITLDALIAAGWRKVE